ncbi:hypothetical protein C8J56DRAFT_899396 [Mycena floridula]|nr:hypothetical protein C8J56DRAFT_899396 [Mycena floridula]
MMTAFDDPRKGCTPFVHPVRTPGRDNWYVLGSGPKAGIYQNWSSNRLRLRFLLGRSPASKGIAEFKGKKPVLSSPASLRFSPAFYYVVRGGRTAFQCSDRQRAEEVYTAALLDDEAVEILVTSDELLALNYLGIANGFIQVPVYSLRGWLRPLQYQEYQNLQANVRKNLFRRPSTFPDRGYSYLLEPEAMGAGRGRFLCKPWPAAVYRINGSELTKIPYEYEYCLSPCGNDLTRVYKEDKYVLGQKRGESAISDRGGSASAEDLHATLQPIANGFRGEARLQKMVDDLEASTAFAEVTKIMNCHGPFYTVLRGHKCGVYVTRFNAGESLLKGQGNRQIKIFRSFKDALLSMLTDRELPRGAVETARTMAEAERLFAEWEYAHPAPETTPNEILPLPSTLEGSSDRDREGENGELGHLELLFNVRLGYWLQRYLKAHHWTLESCATLIRLLADADDGERFAIEAKEAGFPDDTVILLLWDMWVLLPKECPTV